jgi:hypothetical protein
MNLEMFRVFWAAEGLLLPVPFSGPHTQIRAVSGQKNTLHAGSEH